MIVGIGLDTIGVARVAERLRNEEGLKEALFTSAEIGYCEPRQNRDECYAARFAAKEALLKAIGTGGRESGSPTSRSCGTPPANRTWRCTGKPKRGLRKTA